MLKSLRKKITSKIILYFHLKESFSKAFESILSSRFLDLHQFLFLNPRFSIYNNSIVVIGAPLVQQETKNEINFDHLLIEKELCKIKNGFKRSLSYMAI